MAERLNNDFQFLDVARQDPEKKDITVRKAEFVEIYKPFTAEVAANQTHRCLGVVTHIVNGNVQYITTFQTG
jgi:glutamate synthase (NADPH/NADH) small chain